MARPRTRAAARRGDGFVVCRLRRLAVVALAAAALGFAVELVRTRPLEPVEQG